MKRLLSFFLIFLSFFLFSQEELENLENENNDSRAKTFVVSFSKSEIDLSPVSSQTVLDSQIQNAIFEGLVSSHPYTLQPRPGVSYRWEISEEGRLYRFFLREDSKYSNGDKITAQDFKDTWIYSLDRESPFAFMFDIVEGSKDYRLKRVGVESLGVSVVSDSILEIRLIEPYSNFLQILAHSHFAVVHPDVRDLEDINERNVIGNGPYSLTKKSDDSMEFKKNENYWDKDNVQMDTLKLLFFENPELSAQMYLNGEIDWVTNTDSQLLASNKSLQDSLLNFGMFGMSYLYFVENEALSDKRTREALVLSVPETVKERNGILKSSTFVPNIPSYPKPNFNFKEDLNRAKSLLEEAGFEDGSGLELSILLYPGSEFFMDPYKEAWELAFPNIKIELKLAQSYREFIDLQKTKDYDISFSSWVGDFLDPSAFLDLFLKDSSYNYSNFDNEEYESLMEEAKKTQTIKERYVLYSQAETVLLNDFFVIPNSIGASYNLINLSKVDGWYSNLLDYHPFKDIKRKEESLPIYIVENVEIKDEFKIQ